jgi:hypothetical protein
MKRCLLIAMLLLVALAAYANPLVPRVIERVYFDANGDFWVRIGTEVDNFPPFQDMVFSTATGTYPIPDEYQLPADLPVDINLAVLFPGFSINQAADHLTLDTGYWDEAFFWGPANDFSVHLHPLTLGQYAVQIHSGTPDGESMIAWAKDNHHTSTYPYYPDSVCSLRVCVTNQSGSPAAGVPVFISPLHGWVGNYPSRYTDANGQCAFSSLATRYYMEIRDPLTSAVVYSGDLFPEPDETLDITAMVSGTGIDDPTQNAVPQVLAIYPNVLNRSTGSTVRIEITRGNQPPKGARLALYDLKGRSLMERDMPEGGSTQWDLSDLDSGIYFIGLLQHGKVTARSRVTIIK